MRIAKGGVRRIILDEESLKQSLKGNYELIYSFEYPYSLLPESLKKYADAYAKSYQRCVLDENDADCQFSMERKLEKWNQ